MKCPHCGSYNVVNSENRITDFFRRIAHSNKHHCLDCKGKWKSRGRHQDTLAKELLAICFVGLMGFAALKIFTKNPAPPVFGTGMQENGDLSKTMAAQASQEFAAGLSVEDIKRMPTSQKMKFKDAMKGGGMSGLIAKFLANELGGSGKMSESQKRRLREKHKDLLKNMSAADKQKLKQMMKSMNL